jgi:dCMP deaminase
MNANANAGKNKHRTPRDVYYMKLAYVISERSTCIRDRRQIGAVIVNDMNHIVSSGYNGNPRNMKHCDDIGCIRDILQIPSGTKMEICTAVHAEQNAIIQAGPGALGATIYSTILPCNTCAKMIVNSGISRVVYSEDYPEHMGLELMKELGIRVEMVPVEKPPRVS